MSVISPASASNVTVRAVPAGDQSSAMPSGDCEAAASLSRRSPIRSSAESMLAVCDTTIVAVTVRFAYSGSRTSSCASLSAAPIHS
jgi:hypothetical protein